MTTDDPAAPAPAPARLGRRFQLLVSLATLVLMLATGLGISGLAESEAVADFIFGKQLEHARLTGERLMYAGTCTDAGNYLLLDDLPRADFSRGGAYFIGSSTMLHAPKIWEFSREERQRVHNFAINSANVEEQLQWLRFLVEQAGLLRAGGDKTLIVLGLQPYDTRRKVPGTTDEKYVDEMFARHEIYRYDPVQGMSYLPMAPWQRALSITRARAQNVIHALSELVWPTERFNGPSVASDDAMAERTESLVGNGVFDLDMQFSMPLLRETLSYLSQRKVRVVGVQLPVRRFNDRLPYHARYVRETSALFAEFGLPLLDFSDLLEESDFADSGHMNLHGQDKVHPLLAGLVRAHLAGQPLPLPSGTPELVGSGVVPAPAAAP